MWRQSPKQRAPCPQCPMTQSCFYCRVIVFVTRKLCTGGRPRALRHPGYLGERCIRRTIRRSGNLTATWMRLFLPRLSKVQAHSTSVPVGSARVGATHSLIRVRNESFPASQGCPDSRIMLLSSRRYLHHTAEMMTCKDTLLANSIDAQACAHKEQVWV